MQPEMNVRLTLLADGSIKVQVDHLDPDVFPDTASAFEALRKEARYQFFGVWSK